MSLSPFSPPCFPPCFDPVHLITIHAYAMHSSLPSRPLIIRRKKLPWHASIRERCIDISSPPAIRAPHVARHSMPLHRTFPYLGASSPRLQPRPGDGPGIAATRFKGQHHIHRAPRTYNTVCICEGTAFVVGRVLRSQTISSSPAAHIIMLELGSFALGSNSVDCCSVFF